MTGTSLRSIFTIRSVQKRNTEEDIFLIAYNKLITNRSSCDAAGNEAPPLRRGYYFFNRAFCIEIILKLAVRYDKINLTVRQTGFQGVIYGKI